MPSLTGLGILSFPFPGTAVPGYRLFRPYGTGPAPVGDRALLPPACCNTNGVSTTGARGKRRGTDLNCRLDCASGVYAVPDGTRNALFSISRHCRAGLQI